MESITEEEIFDILDGLAPIELVKKHRNLLEHSKDYALIFSELSITHQILSAQTIQEPSAKFTTKILANISFASSIVKEKSKAKYPLFAMAGILLIMIIFSGYMISINGSEIIGMTYLPNINWINSNLAKQTMLIINGLLFLWLLDRVLLKKIMTRVLG